MIRAIAAVTVALLTVITVRAAEQPHRICYSDWGVTCDKNIDVFAHCRSDVNAAARGVCAIRSELGVQFYPYKLTGGPGGGGGACGWRVYNLTCSEMPTICKWSGITTIVEAVGIRRARMGPSSLNAARHRIKWLRVTAQGTDSSSRTRYSNIPTAQAIGVAMPPM